MATTNVKPLGGGPHTKEIQVPEWEHITTATSHEKTSTAQSTTLVQHLRTKLDSILPPHRTYLRLSRNRFLILLTCALLALLALIIGLAAGLHSNSSRNKTLPLPSNTDTHTGELTYYTPGLGACGETNQAGDHIVAVSHLIFDAAGSSSSQNGGNSNANPLCGRFLRATRWNEKVGEMRSVDLKVVDRCTGCREADLDVTEEVFGELADVAEGRVDVSWAWL